MRRLLPAFFLLVLLAGCGSAPLNDDYVKGRSLFESGEEDEGLRLVERAVKADPRNPEYRTFLATRRAAVGVRRTAQGDAAVATGDFEAAERYYRSALAADPGNARAANGRARLDSERELRRQLAGAQADLAAGRLDAAEAAARKALNANPASLAARDMLGRVVAAQSDARAPAPVPGPALNRPVSLDFRDTPLKSVFDGLARSTGVNFVFDKDVRTDTRVTFFVRDTRLDDAIRMVLATQQLDRKLLNGSSMLIYPGTAAKQKDYQELAVRSFYVGNADLKQTLAMLRTVLKTRDLFVDERSNLLVMRDTPEAIRLAEKLIAAQDVPEPEVVLELEVLEVARSRLQELGIQWPNQLSVLNIVPTPTTTTATGGVVVTTSNATTTTTQLTLETLRNLSSDNIGVSPNPSATARAEDSDVNLLANPRIRVRNRDKARVHIGDRVPVITTTSTANVGVSESVAYLDVGLKLDVEPNVYPDQDVAVKLSLEVSSITREVKSAQGTLTYQLGTRNAATVLRVHDGDTQILAGLISEEDRHGMTKVPGLGDLPLIGHLFGLTRDNRAKTEIVLLVTPRIVRNLSAAPGYEAQFPAGTDSTVGSAPLVIASTARATIAPAARPGAPAPARSAATSAPASRPAARLDLLVPPSAGAGGAVDVTLALVDAPQDAHGRAELVYDPAFLGAEGASTPGRLPITLGANGGRASLRVLGAQAGATQVRVENLVVEDAAGRPIEVSAPAAASVNVVAR
jgi:general secretion pathway protein D